MERRLHEVAIDARSEVRLAALRLDTGRQMVSHYREVVVPLRKTVTEQALLHYNGMFISAFQLLAAKQGEVDARRGYLEALRDYWIARAELARALGGSLPPAPSQPAAPTLPPPSTATHPPAPPASEGDHHGH
jgi:cobalt-zinc-cadmium efflux system outer membrane protein